LNIWIKGHNVFVLRKALETTFKDQFRGIVTLGVCVGGLVKSGGLGLQRYLPAELAAFSAASPILELLREISVPFAVRYQPTPPERAFKNYNELKARFDLSDPFWLDQLEDNVVHKYLKGMEMLKNSIWLSSTIRQYLENPEFKWPTDDKAQRLPLAPKLGATEMQKLRNCSRIDSQDQARSDSHSQGSRTIRRSGSRAACRRDQGGRQSESERNILFRNRIS